MENRAIFRSSFLVVLGLMSLTGLAPISKATGSQDVMARPPQYVLISFDGSYTNAMWEATREHGLTHNARYTHFISGVDFLIGSSRQSFPDETKSTYTPPRFNGRLRSNIGFGGSRALLEERLRQVMASVRAGMEVGGHANGHFDGTSWSFDEWKYEFDLFHRFLFDVFSINKLLPSSSLPNEFDWKEMLHSQNVGFRAPFLGRGEGLWKTLGFTDWVIDGKASEHRYLYDASQVSSEISAWPTRHRYGFWNFPLVKIPVPGRNSTILSMDYNFYFAQSGAKEDLARSSQYEEQMYQAYIQWFLRNYHGNRAPISIGHHFSTWNGGAYWRALQRFVESVCSQPEVACITYKEMVRILDTELEPKLNEFQAGHFDQTNRPRIDIPLLKRVGKISDEGVVERLVEKNRFARLPSKSSTWKIGDRALQERTLDLVQLARQGVSFIELEDSTIPEKKTLRLFIDWNPASDSARLRALYDSQTETCPAEAHREDVNPAYLHTPDRIGI